MTGRGAGDRIELRGLRVLGRCGVLPIEVEQAQPLELDLDLELDLAPAAASDDLADTVDYGAVCAAVERTVGAGHVALLERLAALVADAVLAVDGRIDAVDVAVRKLRPPVPQQLATSGVRIRRARDGGVA
ncbi:MAG TPA: dihydroneopterin aldolase [Acidimicrobiales bacterium]